MTPDLFPLAPAGPIGQPAPVWLLLTLKTLGFFLHLVPMNIWFGGMVLVAGLSLARHHHARRMAYRLARAMPVIIALGINFGIVPLLFLQVLYYPVFYPATLLMGWWWFAVIPLLLIAYYGVYYYVLQLRAGRASRWSLPAAVVSAAAFLLIGFIFTNLFSLMANGGQMLALYDHTATGGAVTGTALNLQDPTLWTRWLMMFGLAVSTTAVYLLVDTSCFGAHESEAYRWWARHFAWRLYTQGVLGFAAFGAWYFVGRLPSEVQQAIQQDGRLLALFGATILLPVAVWGLFERAIATGTRPAAVAVAVVHGLVLALNAVGRQWLQSVEVARVFDPATLPVRTQWGPLAVFFALFTVGIGVMAWMLRQLPWTQAERSLQEQDL